MQDNCTTCDIPLFSPELTRQGNHRVTKTLEIKYLYLSLSDQIALFLRNPGVEALLDDWRMKPRNPEEYGDIFDKSMC